MRKDEIQITTADKARLTEMVHRVLGEGGRDVAHLRDLGEELERARIVDSRDIPPNVVTMNSTVRVTELESGESGTYTLVYPENANVDENRVSILAPMATGLLGYRVGDIVEWPVPAGLRKFRIDEILYQPEAAGDHHL